jgi:hypothetical protein
VSIEVTPDAALACDPWVWPLGNVSSAFVDTLGPPGEYVLSVSAANANGDAYWVLRIDNQADLPTPEGVSC